MILIGAFGSPLPLTCVVSVLISEMVVCARAVRTTVVFASEVCPSIETTALITVPAFCFGIVKL